MIGFVVVLMILIFLTLVYQLVSKLIIVGANELAVVAGKGREGFATLRGGRVFVWPLIHRFYRMDLRPQTTSVRVESAIAAGIVPLTVVATVSFAVASSARGLSNAIRRILGMTDDWRELTDIATSIIEGHLRDSIATMTPEQVMTDKDVLVQNMIRVCKVDLEGIGLEITAMNIADVDDHRLEGVEEQELYIALLKRIQATNAETQSREAQALARAAAKEETEARRAEVTTRNLENERESLLAATRVQVAQERQRSAIGVQKATRDAEAQVAGIQAQTEAEKQRIEMLRAKYTARAVRKRKSTSLTTPSIFSSKAAPEPYKPI
jgi:regulator of protease activity HflC (stomatin/prohibitin superfamily)